VQPIHGGVQLQTSLTSTLDGSDCGCFRSACFTTREKSPGNTFDELGGSQGGQNDKSKSNPPPSSSKVQPVATSLYLMSYAGCTYIVKCQDHYESLIQKDADDVKGSLTVL
jgi:hypothetical protein